MKKYVCELCGYEYDARVGDIDNDIEPGTEFEDFPEDWTCPLCGASKEDFEEIVIDTDDDEDVEEEIETDGIIGRMVDNQ